MQSKLQQRVIERLIELHKINFNNVDFSSHNRAQAIYYLQGGAITSAINVSKLDAQVGIIGREWRFISEISYLVEYFDELDDASREIKAWFTKDAVIERKPSKKKVDSTERQKKSGLPLEHFEEYDGTHGKLLHELSRFAHPTFMSVRYNSRRLSHDFDYYQTYQEDPDQLLALKGIFVSEAIACFLSPVNSIPLTEEHFDELLNYKKTLNTQLF
jgi:hypothetical protein